MEFSSRVKCIQHYQEQFPHLPRYMIEMALDYDLENGAGSNEKPKTGAQKRKAKRLKQLHAERAPSLVKQGITEFDAVTVVPAAEFKRPPFVKGYICLDGMADPESVMDSMDEETKEKLKDMALRKKPENIITDKVNDGTCEHQESTVQSETAES